MPDHYVFISIQKYNSVNLRTIANKKLTMPNYQFDQTSEIDITIDFVPSTRIHFAESLSHIELADQFAEYGFMQLEFRFVGETVVHTLRIKGASLTPASLDQFQITRVDGGLIVFGTSDQTIVGSDVADLIYGSKQGATIKAGAGNDHLHGSANNDVLNGDDGNDIIFGNGGDDQLSGGDGDDFLSAFDGNSTVNGGRGNDWLQIGGQGKKYVYGGEGDDNLQSVPGLGSSENQIFGGAGNDSIFGTLGDSLYGEDGDDYLSGASLLDGGNGNDELNGTLSRSNAHLMGGNGNDKLRGGYFNDHLDGGNGDDYISDTGGSNIVEGGDGDDQILLTHSDGVQRIDGGTGDDILIASKGNDILLGGSGNDLLVGGAGNDSLNGGEGNDFFFQNYSESNDVYLWTISFNIDFGSGDDVIDGGTGFDVIKYQGSQSQYRITQIDNKILVDSMGIHGRDTISNVEALVFDDGAVSFGVDSTAAQVYRLYNAAFGRKPDTDGLGYWIREAQVHNASLEQIAACFINTNEFHKLFGNTNDVNAILNGFYENVLHRTPDQEGLAYWKNELATGSLDLAGILVSFSESPENKTLTRTQIEQGVRFNLAMPYLDASVQKQIDVTPDYKLPKYLELGVKLNGDMQDNLLAGDNGNDYLFGQSGNDLLMGLNGDDHLSGGSGNDQLLGGNGSDQLFGGTGLDTIDGGDGIDYAFFGSTTPQLKRIDDYEISTTSGVLRVQELGHPENTSTLRNIERIVFPIKVQANNGFLSPNKVIAFDDTSKEIYKLWYTNFGDSINQNASESYIGYFIKVADRTANLESVASEMLIQDLSLRPAQALLSDFEYVNQLYRNVLQRDLDLAEAIYWTNELKSGHLTRAQVLISLADSQEFTVKLIGSMSSGVEYLGYFEDSLYEE